MTSSTPPPSGEPRIDAEDTRPGVAEYTRDARQKVQQRYSDLEQTYDETRARLEDFNDRAVDFIRHNPGLAIAGAVAAGYLIGRLASRRWLT